jgi:hypothetical protein
VLGGVVELLIAVVGSLFALGGWLFILIVIPGVVGLYITSLFPLVGRRHKHDESER